MFILWANVSILILSRDIEDKISDGRRGDWMNAAERMKRIRLIEKMDKNPEFSGRIGVKNISAFLPKAEKRK